MNDIDKILFEIKYKLGAKNDLELAKILDIPYKTLVGWKTRKSIPKKYLLQFDLDNNQDSETDKIIYEMKYFFGIRTDAELAENLEVKANTIGTWKHRKAIPKKILLQYENMKIAREQKNQKFTQDFIDHIKQTDPNKDFKNLSELKQRLNTKDTKIIAKLLNITHEEALSYENNPIPKKQQEKAKLIATIVKNSKDSFYESLKNFVYVKTVDDNNNESTHLSEDKNMAKLVYLLLNYSNKAICDKIEDELKKIRDIMER